MRSPGDWWRFWRVAGLLAAPALSLFAGSAVADTRVALVIGNSNYESVTQLENPQRDAKAVAELFKQIGFEVTLVLDRDHAGMVSALKEFRRRVAGSDVAAVYYAGHGMEADGENYLVPTDAVLANDDDIDFELLSLEIVLQSVARAKQFRLVILDACRNNPFAAKMANAGSTRAIGRGFVRVEPANNTLVAYAAKDGTVAEDGDGMHSPFATALLKHLAEPGLAVNFVFGRVRDDVLAATGNRQEPFVYGSLGGQAIYLVPPLPAPAPVDPPVAAPAANQFDPKALDLSFWDSIKNSTEAGDYEAYLKQFPNGTFAGLAQGRLSRLQATAAAESKTQVAALTPEVPAAPAAPVIEDLDATYVARQTANVRAEPNPTAKIVAKLSADDAVSATGRVKDKGWLRVQLNDQIGYVTASLLAEVDSSEVADWKALQAAPGLEAAQGFLKKHPNGYFKDRASALVAQLTPPPGPEIEPMDATYVARQAATVRAEPKSSGKSLGKLAVDDAVAIIGRVKGQDWLQVKLSDQQGFVPSSALAETAPGEVADWKALQTAPKLEAAEAYLKQYPDGYFKPRATALVAQLTPAPPAPEIEEMDATYVAKQTVNIREQPSTDTKVIARLSEDEGVAVTGKVKGKDWLRVDVGGKTGYASSGLLVQADAREIADWQAAKQSQKLEAVQAFLKRHPDGHFKAKADALLSALQPPEPPPAPSVESAPEQVAAAAPAPAPSPQPQPVPAAVVPPPPASSAAANDVLTVGETYRFDATLICRTCYQNYADPIQFNGKIAIVAAPGNGGVAVEGQGINLNQISVEQDGAKLRVTVWTDRGVASFSLDRIKPGEYVGSGRMSVSGGPAKGPAQLVLVQ